MPDLLTWRRTFEEDLVEPYGWFSLAGLFWLPDGISTLGSAPDNDFVLDPELKAPSHIGSFTFGEGHLLFTPSEAPVLLGDRALAGTSKLAFEDEPQPSVLHVGPLRVFPIHRGPRYGLRLRSPFTNARLDFGGLRWYSNQPQFRVEAQFVPWDHPRPLSTVNVLGDVEPSTSLGEVLFSLRGRNYRFVAEPGPQGGLFLNFRDTTNGLGSYPGGRFLYTEAPNRGTVTLDFNRAFSPPCARTTYAVCPRPPLANTFDFALEAGEQYPHLSLFSRSHI